MNLNFFTYIGDIISSSTGKKRRTYAITNILYFLFSALCAWGLLALFDYNDAQMQNCTDGGMVLLSWLGMLVCIAGAVEFFILGIVGQLILLVCSIIGVCNPERKKDNVAPLIISAVSIIGMVLGVYFLFIA